MDHVPHTADSRLLSRLFDVDDQNLALWSADDLAAMWCHQLQAPLAEALNVAGFGDDVQHDTTTTFADLLRHPQSPADVLHAIKRFAKRCRSAPQLGLPADIATVLYYAVIVRSADSSLDAKQMDEGLRWAAARPWLDDETRALFHKALQT